MAKKVFVYLIEGFEETEAVTIVDLLRRAGVETITVSLGSTLQVKGDHDIVVTADRLFADTDVEEADMVVLPGGNAGSKNLLAHEGLHAQLLKADAAGKYVTAICAAPMTLGKIGLTRGKKATCYPGVEQALTGAELLTDQVVEDGRLITSRAVSTAISFTLHLIEKLVGREKADAVGKSILAR